VTTWAAALGVTASDVEYLMFSDAASADMNPPWSARPAAATNESRVDEKRLPSLDALDEAATAFVAVRSDISLADLDDFEHGMQNLRPIVLGHARSADTTPQ